MMMMTKPVITLHLYPNPNIFLNEALNAELSGSDTVHPPTPQ